MDYAISKILQQDVTYTILAIRGAEPNGHAIGIHHEKGRCTFLTPTSSFWNATARPICQENLKKHF